MLKVFQMNDCDWWMAHSLQKAIKWWMAYSQQEAIEDYRRTTGEEPDEPRELSKGEMERLNFKEKDGTLRSFASELRRRELTGNRRPGLFASTES